MFFRLIQVMVHWVNLNAEVYRRTWTTIYLVILLWWVFLTHLSLHMYCLLFLNWIVLDIKITRGFQVNAKISSRLRLLKSIYFCIMRRILVNNGAFYLIHCCNAFVLHKPAIYFALFKLELSLLIFDVLVFLLKILQDHFSEYLRWAVRSLTRSLAAPKLI